MMLISASLWSQNAPEIALYNYNMNLYNPAYAGLNANQASFNYRGSGIENGPEIMAGSASVELKNNLSIGLSVINQSVFVSDDTRATADIAYKLQLSDKFDLLMGIKAGMDFYSVDFSDIVLADPNDPLFQGNQSVSNPIFGAGLVLTSDKFFLNVSIPNFLGGEQYKLDSDQSVGVEGEIPMSTLLGAGYELDLGQNLSLTPSVYMNFSSDESVTDLFLTAGFYDFMDLGGMYRLDRSYSVYGLFHFKNLVDLGYSYNTTTGEFQNFNNGSHEIMLKVKF